MIDDRMVFLQTLGNPPRLWDKYATLKKVRSDIHRGGGCSLLASFWNVKVRRCAGSGYSWFQKHTLVEKSPNSNSLIRLWIIPPSRSKLKALCIPCGQVVRCHKCRLTIRQINIIGGHQFRVSTIFPGLLLVTLPCWGDADGVGFPVGSGD